jgi:NAD(P)-dependent dehydrogenase (short-subunit alcohol dehydrogenase family)
MKNLFSLKGKIVLLTGASSGMGKAIAEAMGINGATVIISSNDERSGKRAVQQFIKKNIKAHYLFCDVAVRTDYENMVNNTLLKFKKIDVFVNCTGIAISGSFLDINKEDVEKTMAINLQASVCITKMILPQMMKRKDGVIIYIASIAGVRGNKNIGLYGISKAGLIQSAKNLAVEFGPYNIRVNCISPGLIDTPFSKEMMKNKTVMERRLSLTPLRRAGKPDEIAGVAVLLASKAGAFITGQNIIVDGGTIISDGN